MYKTILSYCFKCRKNTENKNSKVMRTKNRRIILLPKRAVCDKFIKEQKTSALLSSLWTNSPLNKIPLVGPLLFWEYLTSYYKA